MAKRKILIVHDDVIDARQLERRLASLEYEVTGIASSGEEAVALQTRTAPDLLLVELSLRAQLERTAPGEKDQTGGKPPAIFMVAETDVARLGWQAPSEPEGFVVKPCTERELRGSIELALCRHEAARAVDALEDRFFTNSIDMLCLLDFNGYFRRLNPAWERTLGFTRQELMARPFIEFVHPEDRERTLKQNLEVRSGGHALSFENRYRCKDGSYRWFRWNAAPDSVEQVIYSAARDVTVAKRTEEDRERLVRELQSALAEVKTLQDILPICSWCRKIRDDENYWHTVESYISRHTTSRFTHGICPRCLATALGSPSGDPERE